MPGSAARLRKRYVDGPWGQLHVREAGAASDERPAILCLHQSPVSSRMYEPFLAEMGRDRLAVASDTPGYGESDPPPQPVEIADYAAAHGRVLDALGIGAVDLVGTHTGARMAVELALQRPQQVRKLVLIGAAVYTDEERARQRAQHTPPDAKPFRSDGGHIWQSWEGWSRWRWPGVTDEMVTRWVTDSVRDFSRASWALRAVFDHDMAGGLRRLTQPVLVFNVRDDITAATQRAAECLRQGRVVELNPGGIWVLEVRTADMAAKIRGFLDDGLWPENEPLDA